MQPLSCVPPGREVRVVQVVGGRGLRSRMYSMGILPGATLRVLSAGPGPLLVLVRDCRLALGQGLAAKVLVE